LIPDEFYDESIECHGIPDIMVQAALFKAGVISEITDDDLYGLGNTRNTIALLTRLQSAHDHAAPSLNFLEQVDKELHRVAEDFGLKL
jgi:hypothetical protein